MASLIDAGETTKTFIIARVTGWRDCLLQQSFFEQGILEFAAPPRPVNLALAK